MKRAMLLGYLLCNTFYSNAEIIKWDGEAGDGIWSTAANWSGNRAPGDTDDIILDNTFIVMGYQVSLPTGNIAVRVNSLTITPSADQQIILILPVGNVAGDAFIATGSGDAVILNKGGVFINASGAGGGTPVSVKADNFFRINNGGRYIHRTERGHTTNLASRLSSAAGTEYGIFEFDVPVASFTISLTGRVYGTLVFSTLTRGGPVTYSGNGASALHINGDLVIHSGATLSTGMSADFLILHDLRVDQSAVFNLQNNTSNNNVKISGDLSVQGTLTETGSGIPVLELNGNVDQQVLTGGSILNNIIVRINNSEGITLHSSLFIGYQLQLQQGNIRSTAAAMLVMADNAGYTGGSEESFIEGPVKKGGDDEQFIFPIGRGTIYAPLGFQSPGMSVTDTIQAEYFRANPQSLYGINYQTGIDHISYVEHWQLLKTSGALLPASIMLTATPNSFVLNLQSLFVTGYNTTDHQWRNNGSAQISAGSMSTPYMTGSITSLPVTGDGIFTIGTSESFDGNPLPVSIISFSASGSKEGEVSLRWELADCCADILNFQVQRASADKNFIDIRTLPTRNNTQIYDISDTSFLCGTNYYRLKIRHPAGDSSFSKIVSVRISSGNEWSLAFSPTITAGNAVLRLDAPMAANIDFKIYDMQGKILRSFRHKINVGSATIALDLQELRSGIYILTGTTDTGHRVKAIRFVIQH